MFCLRNYFKTPLFLNIMGKERLLDFLNHLQGFPSPIPSPIGEEGVGEGASRKVISETQH